MTTCGTGGTFHYSMDHERQLNDIYFDSAVLKNLGQLEFFPLVSLHSRLRTLFFADVSSFFSSFLFYIVQKKYI